MGKLLFIRGGAVGDFILTMPAIKLVRDHFPDLEVEILGYPSITSLAVMAGLVDRTSSIEHSTLAPFFAPRAQLDPKTCQYFAEFDVVVSYLYDPDGYFSGNLERAGVQTLISGPFRMDESPGVLSAAHQLATPLERLALFLEEPFIEVSYGPVESFPAKTVALHPGSGSPSKNWSFEGWAQLAYKIVEEVPEVSFLIISGEAEHETINDFLKMLDEKNVSYRQAHHLPLPEVGRLIQGCSLFLGHDSGISHLAASTGVNGLVLFGPTKPEIWAPQHPAFRSIQAPEKKMGNFKASAIFGDTSFQSKLDLLR